MKNYVFPLLKAEDIEVRVGNKTKDGSKMTLLLYKTARTDAKYLDEVVGQFNWQKKFYSVNGFTICSLGIRDTETNEWVWKDDAGGESSIEKEKGTCSDAFKRGGFAWGIGRELYSAPTIWVSSDINAYDLSVKEIVYNEKTREIVKVVILDSKGNQVYPKEYAPKQSNSNTTKGSITSNQRETIEKFLGELEEGKRKNWYDYMDRNFETMSIASLSQAQADKMLDLIRKFKIQGK